MPDNLPKPIFHGEMASATTTCRNCDHLLGDPPHNFCPLCGQETALHPPSLAEFIHEFVGHYIALEGPLGRTLTLLFFRPGELTREYLQGRKRRYVLPLRLYLSISLVFFLVIGSLGTIGGPTVNFGKPNSAVIVTPVTAEEIKSSLVKGPGEEQAANVARSLDKAAHSVNERTGEAVSILNEQTKYPVTRLSWDNCSPQWLCTRLKHRLDTWRRLPSEDLAEVLKVRALHTAPIAMFVLLPLYALLLKLFYINRRMYFGEHLVFSFHLHSFMFLLLMAMMLPIDWLGPVLLCWLLIYPLFALKRVYGGRWLPTLMRGVTIAFFYSLALIPALLMFSLVFLAA